MGLFGSKTYTTVKQFSTQNIGVSVNPNVNVSNPVTVDTSPIAGALASAAIKQDERELARIAADRDALDIQKGRAYIDAYQAAVAKDTLDTQKGAVMASAMAYEQNRADWADRFEWIKKIAVAGLLVFLLKGVVK